MDAFSAILGAIIGGSFSIMTTLILICNERKSDYSQWLRAQKIQIYIELSNALSKVDIAVSFQDSCDRLVLDSDGFKEKSKILYDYTDEHLGELELFLPGETHKEIIKFKSLLYNIVSSNNSLEFEMDSFKNKKGLAYELIRTRSDIIQMLRNDLRNFSNKKQSRNKNCDIKN